MSTPTLDKPSMYARMFTPPSSPAREEDSLSSPPRIQRGGRTCLLSCPSIVLVMIFSAIFGAYICSTVDRFEVNTMIGLQSSLGKPNSADHGAEDESNSLMMLSLNKPSRDDSNERRDWPKLAWLMSFPNSGTSYTTKMIRHVTGMSTATNYGDEYSDNEGLSVPLIANATIGPYLIDPHKYGHPKGQMYILTKTHCGGRCATCAPRDYVETPTSFLYKCLNSKGVVRGKGDVPVTKEGAYPLDDIKRIIHLIRNPFDNVVSRFHLELKRNREDVFPVSKNGFRDFCKAMDKKWNDNERESTWWDEDLRDIIKDVPCHADFYRYASWHNLAFAITSDLALPTLVLHYEKFESNFNETKNAVMEFLHVKQNGDDFSFIAGKTYVDYFTLKERRAMKKAMQVMAFKTTWSSIEHYFEDL